MSYWGYVIESLTHETEREQVARLHRRRRREASRLLRPRARVFPRADQC